MLGVSKADLCGRSDRTRHVEAHHFCKHVSEDFHQCIIYDSGEPDAKLIGIEYIASEKVGTLGSFKDVALLTHNFSCLKAFPKRRSGTGTRINMR